MPKKSPVVVPDKEYTTDQKTCGQCSIELYPDSTSYNFKVVLCNILYYCFKNKAVYHYMHHDQDYYNDTTFDSFKKVIGVKGQAKKHHVHIAIKFKSRVAINDICLEFGIEDRWLKILKHDYDFDNMIVYQTHILYNESEKHHYSINDGKTNISDYAHYLYDKAVEKAERKQDNICVYVLNYLEKLNGKTNTANIMQYVLMNDDYTLYQFNQYYRIIKDMIFDHNKNFDIKVTDKACYSRLREKEQEIAQLARNIETITNENMYLRGIDNIEERKDIFKE